MAPICPITTVSCIYSKYIVFESKKHIKHNNRNGTYVKTGSQALKGGNEHVFRNRITGGLKGKLG